MNDQQIHDSFLYLQNPQKLLALHRKQKETQFKVHLKAILVWLFIYRFGIQLPI